MLGVGAAAQAELFAPGATFFVDDTGPLGDLYGNTITAHAALVPVTWLAAAMTAAAACALQGRKKVASVIFAVAVLCLIGLGILSAGLFLGGALLDGRGRIWTTFPVLAPDSSAFLKVRPEILAYIIATASGPALTIIAMVAAKRQRGTETMRWSALGLILISLGIAYRVTQTSSNRILASDQTFSAHWLEATALLAATIWALSLCVALKGRRVPFVIPVAGTVLLWFIALFFMAMSRDAWKMGMPRRYLDYPAQFEFALKTASVFGFAFVAVAVAVLAYLVARRNARSQSDEMTDAF